MKALRVAGNRATVSNVPLPERQDEALIRVLKSGICNTDLEIVHGYAGFTGTIGHEFVGVVEAADTRRLIGTRVVGEINAGCGICELCLKGDPRHCPQRTVLGIKGRDGAHAEFLTLPETNLVEVPNAVSDAAAVFAEPLAAAFGITERVDILPSDHVAVIGDGKLGLLCAFCLRLKTQHVVLVGRHPQKLAVAAARDIETALEPSIEKFHPSYDIVVEASGSASGFATALDLVKPRGKIVLKSTFHGKPVWEAWRVVVDEISIIGSRCGRLAPAIGLLASKRVKVDDLISDEFGLSRGVSALEAAARKGILKVLLDPSA